MRAILVELVGKIQKTDPKNLEKWIIMMKELPPMVGKITDMVGTMPNIKSKTIGGKFMWDTIVESDGWKVQKNKLTNHYRILDADNVRHAWGSKGEMEKKQKTLSKQRLSALGIP